MTSSLTLSLSLTLSPHFRPQSLNLPFLHSCFHMISFWFFDFFFLNIYFFLLFFVPSRPIRSVCGWMAAGRQQWQHQSCAQLHHLPQQPPGTQDSPGGGDAGQSVVYGSFRWLVGREEEEGLGHIYSICLLSIARWLQRVKKQSIIFHCSCFISLNGSSSHCIILQVYM